MAWSRWDGWTGSTTTALDASASNEACPWVRCSVCVMCGCGGGVWGECQRPLCRVLLSTSYPSTNSSNHCCTNRKQCPSKTQAAFHVCTVGFISSVFFWYSFWSWKYRKCSLTHPAKYAPSFPHSFILPPRPRFPRPPATTMTSIFSLPCSFSSLSVLLSSAGFVSETRQKDTHTHTHIHARTHLLTHMRARALCALLLIPLFFPVLFGYSPSRSKCFYHSYKRLFTLSLSLFVFHSPFACSRQE